MKVLKITSLVLVSLVVLGAAGGFLLPDREDISRSVIVNAPPSAVFPAAIEVAPESWTKDDLGEGTITGFAADSRVDVEVVLARGFAMKGAIVLEPDTLGTRMTWTDTLEPGNNPIRRYVAQAFKKRITLSLEQTLSEIKLRAEKAYAAPEPALAP